MTYSVKTLVSGVAALLFTVNVANATTVDFSFDDGDTVIAVGSLTYPTGLTGGVDVNNVTDLNITAYGTTYDIHDIGVYNPYLEYDIANNAFIPDIYGGGGVAIAIIEGNDGGVSIFDDKSTELETDFGAVLVNGVGHDPYDHSVITPLSASPEPGTWGLMSIGVGIAGLALRRAAYARRIKPVRPQPA